MSFNESIVEDHAIAQLAAIGVRDRTGIGVDDGDERTSLSMVALSKRSRALIAKLNRHLPVLTIDALITHLYCQPCSTLIENNRWYHNVLTDGVRVRKVRRLLALYGFPPDLSEDATQLVLKQAELSTQAGE